MVSFVFLSIAHKIMHFGCNNNRNAVEKKQYYINKNNVQVIFGIVCPKRVISLPQILQQRKLLMHALLPLTCYGTFP
jgi:hypothetical protein